MLRTDLIKFLRLEIPLQGMELILSDEIQEYQNKLKKKGASAEIVCSGDEKQINVSDKLIENFIGFYKNDIEKTVFDYALNALILDPYLSISEESEDLISQYID